MCNEVSGTIAFLNTAAERLGVWIRK